MTRTPFAHLDLGGRSACGLSAAGSAMYDVAAFGRAEGVCIRCARLHGQLVRRRADPARHQRPRAYVRMPMSEAHKATVTVLRRARATLEREARAALEREARVDRPAPKASTPSASHPWRRRGRTQHQPVRIGTR